MIRILPFAMLLLCGSALGQVVTIDFEAAGGGAAPVAEDGFTVTSTQAENLVFTPGMAVDNGTNIFGWCANACGAVQQITIAGNMGEVFSLTSIDSANLSAGSITPGQTLDVVGTLSGGGTVNQSFTLVADTYTTFNLNANFVGLTSIQISSDPAMCPTGICDVGIDNLVLNLGAVAGAPAALPVPTLTSGAMVLMVLLIGWVALRRIGIRQRF